MSLAPRLLPETETYPKGSLQYCSASSSTYNKGGTKRWRLCLNEPGYTESTFWVAARTANIYFTSSPHHPFTVSLEGRATKVWIDETSLETRFSVSRTQIKAASSNDNLWEIIRAVKTAMESPQLRLDIPPGDSLCPKEEREEKEGPLPSLPPESKAESLIRRAKLSRVGCYIPAFEARSLDSMYVCRDLIAYKIKKSLIDVGSSAKLKKARLADGTLLARRVVIVTPDKKLKVERTIKHIQRFKDNPHVAACLGIFDYASKNRNKVVTLHPLYEQDLCKFFLFGPPLDLSESTRLGYIRQLLEGLLSIQGDHGDLRPENILLKGDTLVLHDFEYFVGWEEQIEDGAEIPCGFWSPPEITPTERRQFERKKLDSWAAGFILSYLFSYPHIDAFPLHASINRSFDQKYLDKYFARSPLSDSRRYLVSRLARINPTERFTIEEALAYFNTHIAKDADNIK